MWLEDVYPLESVGPMMRGGVVSFFDFACLVSKECFARTKMEGEKRNGKNMNQKRRDYFMSSEVLLGIQREEHS